jgi:hypothetical protein
MYLELGLVVQEIIQGKRQRRAEYPVSLPSSWISRIAMK